MTGQIIHYYQEDNIKTEQLPSKTEQPKQEQTTTEGKVVKLKRKVTIKKKSNNCQELSLF